MASAAGLFSGEVFPSELRASGIGLATAASRVGAAAGTFLLPIGISHIGVGPSVLIGAGVCVVGAIVSHVWAPENDRGTYQTRALAREQLLVDHWRHVLKPKDLVGDRSGPRSGRGRWGVCAESR